MTFMAMKHPKTDKTPKPPETPDASPKIKKNDIEAMTHAPEIKAAFACCVIALYARGRSPVVDVPSGLDGLGLQDSNGFSSMAQTEYSSEYSLPQYGHRFI
jgi:hypothetical protein